jgi:hypothetical protein
MAKNSTDMTSVYGHYSTSTKNEDISVLQKVSQSFEVVNI